MPLPELQKKAPDFKGIAVIDKQFKEICLDNYKGKYLVLFFYPLDFTFVCPTEIIAFSDRVKEFRNIGCEVVAASCDSHFSHLAWINVPRKEGGVGDLQIPLLADKSFSIAKAYGVLNEETGIPYRGLFIIDKNQRLRQITVNDLPVGRSVDETLRLVQAFQYTDIHGEVCPANWKPGSKTMKPTPKESLDYFKQSVTLHTDVGDIKLELFCEACPKTCENFLALCASDYYKGCMFHRNIKGFIVQTGDPTQSGKGGNSIYGKKFEDEFREELKHTARGMVSMANNGPNTNGSQFFITYGPQPHLDMKYTLFGKVIDGFDALDELEKLAVNPKNYRPLTDAKINDVSIHANPLAGTTVQDKVLQCNYEKLRRLSHIKRNYMKSKESQGETSIVELPHKSYKKTQLMDISEAK